MEKCAITGANGYVGSVIREALGTPNVLSLLRRPQGPQEIEWSFASSRDIVPDLRAGGVKILIHAAWDMKASSEEEIERVCVQGSRRLFEAADQAGVERIIFISTISAFEGCRSVYGRKKLQVEQMVRVRGGIVLRPGLVFGPNAGGAFGNLFGQVCRSTFVPVINMGREPQYLLSVQTLAEAVRRAARGELDNLSGQPLTLAHPKPWSFRQLAYTIAEIKGCKAHILPIPWQLLYAGLRGAEALRIRLRFRSDSVISVVYANPNPDFSQMISSGIRPLPFPEGLNP